MSRLLRNHRTLIYALKRQFGQRVVFYTLTSQTQNVTTGKIVRKFRTVTVKRAPVLPRLLDRDFVYDLTYIAANNNFVYGGLFNRKTQQVIIPQKELPSDYIPKLEDLCIVKNKQYEIKSVMLIEQLAFYDIRLESIENQDSFSWETLSSILNLAVTAEGTIV